MSTEDFNSWLLLYHTELFHLVSQLKCPKQLQNHLRIVSTVLTIVPLLKIQKAFIFYPVCIIKWLFPFFIFFFWLKFWLGLTRHTEQTIWSKHRRKEYVKTEPITCKFDLIYADTSCTGDEILNVSFVLLMKWQ